MVVERFDIFLVSLNPTIGKEIKKTRPCLIVSPDEMNRHLSTVIIAPLTTGGFFAPSRIHCKFKRKEGKILLDQIRCVDKIRLIKKSGTIDRSLQQKVINDLAEMYAP